MTDQEIQALMYEALRKALAIATTKIDPNLRLPPTFFTTVYREWLKVAGVWKEMSVQPSFWKQENIQYAADLWLHGISTGVMVTLTLLRERKVIQTPANPQPDLKGE